MKSNKKINNINEYIEGFPEDMQKVLQRIRKTIKIAAPKAEEAMKYGIPTFVLNGNLVHFGGFKGHVSFFPTPSAIAKFKKELSKYRLSKGTVQFPLDKTIPYDLIKKITQFRVKEVLAKDKVKNRK